MQARLQDAERRIQQLERALLEHAPTLRGTLAAFADYLRASIANALTRLNAVWYSLLWLESFVLTAFCNCNLIPCRFDEDDDERRLTIAVGLIAFICTAKILYHPFMASME